MLDLEKVGGRKKIITKSKITNIVYKGWENIPKVSEIRTLGIGKER